MSWVRTCPLKQIPGLLPPIERHHFSLLMKKQLSGGVVLGALNVVLAQSGTGKPTKLRTPAQDSDAMRLGFVCKELYTFTLMTVKLAICAFYARIFQDKGGRLFIYSMSGFVVLSTIPIMVAHGLRCDPPAGNLIVALNVILLFDLLIQCRRMVADASKMPLRISHHHLLRSLQHPQRHRPPRIHPP